jgi:hypothetical protein
MYDDPHQRGLGAAIIVTLVATTYAGTDLR